jgi:hypothetical protein
MAKSEIFASLHYPYFPDLASCDFLFSDMKLKLKGKRFNDVLEIQKICH